MSAVLYWKPDRPVEYIQECCAAHLENPDQDLKQTFQTVGEELENDSQEEFHDESAGEPDAFQFNEKFEGFGEE